MTWLPTQEGARNQRTTCKETQGVTICDKLPVNHEPKGGSSSSSNNNGKDQQNTHKNHETHEFVLKNKISEFNK